MKNVKISDNGIQMLASEEGYKKVAYPDPHTKSGWCICFGNHYHPNGTKVRRGDTVSFDKNSPEAKNYITKHMEMGVYREFGKIIINLNQNQIDALCQLIYAVGHLSTKIAEFINENHFGEKLKKQWRSHNFNKSNSIDKRRTREYNLFLGNSVPIVKDDVSVSSKNKKVTPNKTYANQNMYMVHNLKKDSVREAFLWFIDIINQRGYTVIITSAFRTKAQQQILYNKNHKNAKPGNSRHESGQAIDMNIINIKTRIQYTKEKGHNSKEEWLSTGIPQIAKEFGMIWGGDAFRNYHDPVHFEIPIGGIKVPNLSKFSSTKNEIDDGKKNFNENSKSNQSKTDLTQFGVAFGGDGIKSLTTTTNSEDTTGEITPNEKTKPTPSVEYTTVRDSNVEIDTLQKFIDFYNVKMTPQEILDYQPYNNKVQMYLSYTNEQKKKYGEASADLLVPNTRLGIPRSKLFAGENSGVNSKIIENNNYNAFIEKSIKEIIGSKDYKKLDYGNKSVNSGSIFKKESWCKIWVWSKSLDNDGSTLTNITNFAESVNINVNKNGGNFSIVLPHITIGKKDIKTLSDLFVYEYEFAGQKNYVNKDTLHFMDEIKPSDLKAMFGEEIEGGEQLIRKFSFFNKLLQNNDIIFIRMEKLGIDKNTIDAENEFKISNSSLPNNYFDMIGLVSNLNDSVNAEGGARKLTVTGQDLSKLIIDDGVYFFPIEYIVKDREQIILNSANHKSGNRVIIEPKNESKDSYYGNIQNNLQGFMPTASFNFDKTQSIEEWLVFIFTQLTNIDIVHDNLFNFFEEKTFTVSREAFISGNDIDLIKASGIWQIVKLVIDKEVGQRRLADQSFVSATGSLLNLIRRICQEPFVEFFMDTYGDKYYFICRKPPFSEESYKSNFTINIYEEDVISDSLSFNNEFYTWFKLTPSGSLLDSNDGASMTLLPAVLLPEYVEVWGSKILDIPTQYLDIDVSQSDKTESNLDAIQKQGRQDLDWLIEINAYLPFARQGSIVVKSDRRIKRGMNIRYVPTGELFYVDGVGNNREFGDIIGGVTALQVTRGIVEKHYDKYFSLVNLLRNNKNSDKWDPTTWSVNNEIFKFLLQRKQY